MKTRQIFNRYTVAKDGTIIDEDTGETLTARAPKKERGKRVYMIDDQGRKIARYVHRLVAHVYVHNPDPKRRRCVAFKDGDPLNVHPDNLEWQAQSDINEQVRQQEIEKRAAERAPGTAYHLAASGRWL